MSRLPRFVNDGSHETVALSAWADQYRAMDNVRSLIEEFTTRLTTVVEQETIARARLTVENALGARRSGRPGKITPIALSGRPRRKAPLQLCPVPGCKNPAAPVFGMVCAKHKELPKSKIREYREQRRAKKEKAKKAA